MLEILCLPPSTLTYLLDFNVLLNMYRVTQKSKPLPNYQTLCSIVLKLAKMRLHFFVKLKKLSSTTIVFVGIKCHS